MQKDGRYWFETHENMTALARHLQEEGHWNGPGGIKNLIYFFEKPWKYEMEWIEFQNEKESERRKNAETTRQ